MEKGLDLKLPVPFTLYFFILYFGLHLMTNNLNIHLFTKKPIQPYIFKSLELSKFGLANYVESRMKTLTIKDMNQMIARIENNENTI